MWVPYDFIYIYRIHLFHRNIWTHNWPAPNISGFIAQLVRASHRYRKGTGLSPVRVLNFFRLLMQLHKLHSQLWGSFFIWSHFRINIYHIHLLHGKIIWTHNWPAPNTSGFTAQLVRASHQYRETTGSNPIGVLNYFQASYANAQIAFTTARIILHLTLRDCWWFIETCALALKGLEEDSNETERVVRGYLNNRSHQSGALTVSRTVPARQSRIKYNLMTLTRN